MKKKNRLVCGVGINDANYVVRKETIILENGERKRLKTWICPYYRTWINMLKRCYSAKEQQRCPTIMVEAYQKIGLFLLTLKIGWSYKTIKEST